MNDHKPKPGEWSTPSAIWERLKPEVRRMRSQPTSAESVLWEALRNRKLRGFRFRRQHAIGRFIVDFYCSEASLVVDVDGPIHKMRRDEEDARDEFLRSRGLRVLRFGNERVEKELEGVLAEISEALLSEAEGDSDA